MPLQATSGAASYDAFGGGVPVVPNYIEDVFSTYLYTGTGSTLSIVNGIDLSTKGGLVWTKVRTSTYNHVLTDTVRGLTNELSSNLTSSQVTQSAGVGVTSFNANGYTLGTNPASGANYQNDGQDYVSWTFREQPKFFDIVTYTGDGANRTIAHALGSVPGCIMVKRTNTTGAWQVYHRSLANTEYLVLNTTAAKATGATRWNSTTPTSTVFSLGTDATVNASGGTYVAYIFAHDAGGFGLTGTDNVISCGSFTTDGSGNASINLGYEPQFWLYKPTIAARYWTIYDTMRGWSQTQIANLSFNVSDAEGGGAATAFYPTATGFDCVGGNLDASTEHIYIAIRRGPMKVPTDATKVFKPFAGADTPSITTNFPVDMFLDNNRASGSNNTVNGSKLVGKEGLRTSDTGGELPGTLDFTSTFQSNTSYLPNVYGAGESIVAYAFQRAPTYFDVCCYIGTGSNTTQTHNLGAVPQLIIVKSRSATAAWQVYSSGLANTEYLVLNTTAAKATGATRWNSTTPTSSVFSLGTSTTTNASAATYVAYLFSTCAGVSKVGSYTGNGSTQTIDCGFGAGGARFVLIKRTDSTSGWYVYDTARGMTVLTDPYLFLNDSSAESATLGSVTTVSTGFALNSTILAAINVSAGTYIFLAIA